LSDNEPSLRRGGEPWDPQQYEKFSDHRLRPAAELLARIPLTSPEVIVDLGCGPGNVTRLIAKRWPAARVYAIDNSEEMLARPQSNSTDIHWEHADIADWVPTEAPDLIYSNAALHWLDHHRALIPRLTGCLRARGCLAVQMPLSWDLPSHRLMRETLVNGGAGGQPLGTQELRTSAARKWVGDAEFYFDLLTGTVCNLDIWETEYLQVFEGEDAVLEWVRGTGLRPILNALDDDERAVFLTTYRRRLREAYPVKPDGKILYPFRRLFMVAVV